MSQVAYCEHDYPICEQCVSGDHDTGKLFLEVAGFLRIAGGRLPIGMQPECNELIKKIGRELE